jgi:uncharacterized protein (TIGR03083 family)
MALDHLVALEREGTALAATARTGPLDNKVPSCPDWDLAALVAHTSRVQRWATIAIGAKGEPAGRFPRPPEDRGEIPGWYEAGLAELLAALRAEPDEAPAWNFAGVEPATVAFWRRRMAQETAVHRWDAQAAVGAPEAIEPELAADGIDELMAFFAARRLAQIEGGVDLGGTIHVHCTDVPGEWTFTARGTTFEATGGHAKGDVALRGPAAELLLVLWGRRTLDDAEVGGGEGSSGAGSPGNLDVFGDRAVAERWLALGMP